METGGHLRGRANFALIFPATLPIQKYETPYNTTEPKICQDLFCEKIHRYRRIFGFGSKNGFLGESPAILRRDDYDGGGGVVSGFFNKVVDTRRVP